jgi:hypothetical protein
LKLLDGLLIKIDEHAVTQQSLNMPQRIARINGRPWVSQSIAGQILFANVADSAHPFVTIIVDVIEAFLQLAPAFLLGRAGDGLRCGPGRLLDALACDQNSYHQIFPRLIRDIAGYSLISPHSGGAAVNQRDSRLQLAEKRAMPPVLPAGIAPGNPPL